METRDYELQRDLEEREENEAHLKHLIEFAAGQDVASHKYLTFAHAGLGVALATWLQNCFTGGASVKQQAMIEPILLALCATGFGFAITLLIPYVHMLTIGKTARLVKLREERRLHRRRQPSADSQEQHKERGTWLALIEVRSALRALAWARGVDVLTIASWFAFVGAVVIVILGAFSANVN